jgi:hypothetical protein
MADRSFYQNKYAGSSETASVEETKLLGGPNKNVPIANLAGSEVEGTAYIPEASGTSGGGTDTAKMQRAMVDGPPIKHVPYSIVPVQIDFKIPLRAFSEESTRTGPLMYVPPKEGRAIFIVEWLDGEQRSVTTYDNLYITSLRLTDMEAIELHDTFTKPFLHSFGRRPRSLMATIALPNTKQIVQTLNVNEIPFNTEDGQQKAFGDAGNKFGDWRNDFKRFYEDMRASEANSTSLKIQDTVYSGHVVGISENIMAESDSLSVITMEMIVFDVEYPWGEEFKINEVITLLQPDTRQNKFLSFLKRQLEKLNKNDGVIDREKDPDKTTSEEQSHVIEEIKAQQEAATSNPLGTATQAEHHASTNTFEET